MSNEHAPADDDDSFYSTSFDSIDDAESDSNTKRHTSNKEQDTRMDKDEICSSRPNKNKHNDTLKNDNTIQATSTTSVLESDTNWTWFFQHYMEQCDIPNIKADAIMNRQDDIQLRNRMNSIADINTAIITARDKHQHCHGPEQEHEHENPRSLFKECTPWNERTRNSHIRPRHSPLWNNASSSSSSTSDFLQSTIESTRDEISKRKENYHSLSQVLHKTLEQIQAELEIMWKSVQRGIMTSNDETLEISNQMSTQMDLEALLLHKQHLVQSIHQLSQQQDVLVDAIQRAQDTLLRQQLQRFDIIHTSVGITNEDERKYEDDGEIVDETHQKLNEEITQWSLKANNK